MAVLGIDIGTTGCKCAAFGDNMKLLGKAYREYPLINKQRNTAEQDPDLWWKAVTETIIEVTASVEPVSAIGVSSQGITFIAVDEMGTALGNAMTWLDMRAEAECDFISNKLGIPKIFSITGKRANPAYTLPKLLWLKANEPDLYNRTYKFLMVHDYIINKLCGVFVTEHSLAAGTLAYDIRMKSWDDNILGTFGIDKDKLPLILESGSVAGKLDDKTALTLGLPPGIVVTVGGQDQKCAAYGAGLARGNITVSLGTSAAITGLFDKPVLPVGMKLPCFPHIDGKNWVLEGFCSTAGASVKWFHENLGNGMTLSEMDSAIETEYDNLPDSGTMFFPYMGGTATPGWYDSGDGTFYGIGLETTDAIMAAAVLEGTAFNIRANIEVMESIGESCDEITVFGGGAKSRIWLGMIADVCGKNVKVPAHDEMVCLGAAMKAADSLGIKNKPSGTAFTIKPDDQKHIAYNIKYNRYKKIEKIIYGG